MPTIEFLMEYFTSPLPLIVISMSLGSFTTASYLFFSNPDATKVRSGLLTTIFTVSTFNWAFIGFSLVMCEFMYEIYGDYTPATIKTVFGSALLVGIAFSLPLSRIIIKNSSKVILSKLDVRTPTSDTMELSALETIEKLAKKMDMKRPDLAVSDRGSVLLSVGGERPTIVVSRDILKLLEKEEFETAMAHELAHIKNGDTGVKATASVFKKVLFFDPLIRLTESAIHREREFLADRNAAIVTKKPVMLASALLKIYELLKSHRTPSFVSGLAIVGIDKGILSKHPPIEKRIEKLLRIEVM